ncbi:MAG TPA: HEPN domain-containing protein [Desulfuromonadales bacterium]|nr:HEPN domain-containing protein [Desulfuromonadales bacterium]
MNVNSEASMLLTMAGKDIDLLRYIISSDIVADEIFGFHAQQAAEKSLKAWIIGAGGTIDRTHDVRRLLIMLQDLGFDVACYRELIPLNSFAVQFRYEAMEEEDVPLNRAETLSKVECLHGHVKALLAKAP